MASFGITQDGFTIKGLDIILSESLDRARQMFGLDIDVTATSVLRKLIEVTAYEDAELWKRMEDVYYSNFISTAIGDTLDRHGENLGVTRQFLFAQGQVTCIITNPLPGRQYTLPEGTVIVGAAAMPTFYTTTPVTLSADVPQVQVTVQAFQRGVVGNIAANTVKAIDPTYVQIYGKFTGTTAVAVSNDQAFTGGEQEEADEDYRARLLGLPRTIWTVERVRRAVLDIAGVIDVFISDPLGGVDVSQSYFNLFTFNQRAFSTEPRLGEPYFFDIVVAHEFAWPWQTQGTIQGVFERALAVVDELRPVGIHPNIVQADHIEVGVHAKVIIESGSDTQSIMALIKQQIATGIGELKLGGNVLFSQVMRAIVEQPGVVDVQNMHLRRSPAAFGRITFGSVSFLSSVQEVPVGENLIMGPTEIAIFRIDSPLLDLEVVAR